MKSLKLVFVLWVTMYVTSAEACRYTIREIGFSTLSKVTYVLYRIDENKTEFPKQQEQAFLESNIKTSTIGFDAGSNPVVAFAKAHKLALPAYVLVDKNGRMLALTETSDRNNLRENVLNSPVQNQLLKNLPINYASVILIEGINKEANEKARQTILEACGRITNIMPNMPKQVAVGPDMITIRASQFKQEQVVLWSLGVTSIPEDPLAFVVYGKGRIMGEKIEYDAIGNDTVYKLLSIIGADCECGLDRKWMLGYQIPLDWPKETRQGLSDRLGFDVDNPMVLTEMSRILAIENRAPVDPDGVSYEPIVVDLDDEFDEIPEIVHAEQFKIPEEKVEDNSNAVVWYSLAFLFILIGVGAYFILKRK
ncbi:hypothetical protein [Snuella sedimenti]|uniref:Uncharacterized protein n=1 Tax=Snuella sedimenti TaxID=2798802 RepID=A0A8J7J399_9FLAO|nr:hypothetical protein [Snuella sedimenti]MBJ6368962.1 hypothetical protein [Snuella sedimenti]